MNPIASVPTNSAPARRLNYAEMLRLSRSVDSRKIKCSPTQTLEATQTLESSQIIVEQIAGSISRGNQPPPLTRGVPPLGILQMRQHPIERSAAYFCIQVNPGGLNQMTDLAHRDFLFHCLYIPLYSLVVTKVAMIMDGVSPLMLHEYAANYLAFERLLIEMIFVRKSLQGEQFKAKSLISIFDNPPKGFAFWGERFKEWRASVVKSHMHFMYKRVPDVKQGGTTAVAALLGDVLRRKHKLSIELFGDMMSRIEQDQSIFRFSVKNYKKPKPARWGEPELDTWLIEIWPLVTRYGWNYREVWDAALAKWGDKCDNNKSFGGVTKIEDRCKKMLGLKLGSIGQNRGGREKYTETPQHPLCFKFAVAIESIGLGEENWALSGPILKIMASR